MKAIVLSILALLLCAGCSGFTFTHYNANYDDVDARIIAVEFGEDRVPVADAICAVKQEPNTCEADGL